MVVQSLTKLILIIPLTPTYSPCALPVCCPIFRPLKLSSCFTPQACTCYMLFLSLKHTLPSSSCQTPLLFQDSAQVGRLRGSCLGLQGHSASTSWFPWCSASPALQPLSTSPVMICNPRYLGKLLVASAQASPSVNVCGKNE